MTTIGISEAKTHLPRLLKQVAQGETIIITRHGVPVAQLGPLPGGQDDEVAKAIKQWRLYQEEHHITLGGIPIAELVQEGGQCGDGVGYDTACGARA